MKRLGIFIFFDPQGIVDDYVLHLLNEMHTVCTEIVTICNGKPTEEGYKRIYQYSKTVFIRENQGMDAGALKDYFTHLGENEYWNSFDELVWFNDTCYGPIFSMKDVFQRMDSRCHCDFWGITMHAKSNAQWPGCKESGIAEHLQSYFIVVKQPLLSDERFYSFWDKMEISNDFNKTVANYELSLTRSFVSWGYSYGVYCNTVPYDTNPNCVCNLTADGIYMLISKYKCPFIKRKSFIRNRAESLIHTNGEQVLRAMQYIRENSDYDCSLIYQNLLRLYDQSMWQVNMGHNHIISATSSGIERKCQALILAELNHKDTVLELAENLKTLPEECSLIAVTSHRELKNWITEHLPTRDICFLSSDKNGIGYLFSALERMNIERYEYFCFLPEYWGTSINGLHLPESSLRYNLYGNMVKSPYLIRNLFHLFQTEDELGVLIPQLFSRVCSQRQYTKEDLCKFGITPPNCYNEECMDVLAAWCRKEIVNEVLKHPNMIKNGEVGYLLCLLGQSKGFYSARIVEERQASVCLIDNRQGESESIYSGLESIELLWYQRAFQNIAEINAGKIDADSLDMRLSQFIRLIVMTIIFFFEKKINPRISAKKRQTFFLGVRDVYNAYRRVRKSIKK